MTERDADGLETGLARLDRLYREAIGTFAPPNPAFERDRIIGALATPRELAFVLGFLAEGENEAALLLELMREMRRDCPEQSVAHILDEAWYYLRTSIDATWQLDGGEPSVAAALAYLITMLERRIARLRTVRRAPPLADDLDPGARAVLERLRLVN